MTGAPQPQIVTEWECRGCNLTVCHYRVDAELRTLFPHKCPVEFSCCRWGKIDNHPTTSAGEVLADYRRNVLAGIEKCLLRPDFNNVRKILDHEFKAELRQQAERERES